MLHINTACSKSSFYITHIFPLFHLHIAMNSYLIHTSLPQDFVYPTSENMVPSNKFTVDDIEPPMTGYMPCTTTGSMDPLNVSAAPLPPQTLPPSNADFFMAPPLEMTWPLSATGTRPEALPMHQAYSYYHETSLVSTYDRHVH